MTWSSWKRTLLSWKTPSGDSGIYWKVSLTIIGNRSGALAAIVRHRSGHKGLALRRPFFLPRSSAREVMMNLRSKLAAAILGATLAFLLMGCAAAIDFGPAKAPSPGAVTGMDHILLTVAD